MGSIEELQKRVDYWKNLADDYKQNYEACKQELEEFQTSSRELELEMETQLDQSEKRTKELTNLNSKQKSDLDGLRDKYNALQAQFNTEVTRIEDDLNQTRFERDEAQRCIRELETMNDDLERAKRALVASLDDFEKRMNDAIERNAFLESELDEKDLLATSVQRLKDETKDLKQELQVRDTVRDRLDSHRSSGSSRPPSLGSASLVAPASPRCPPPILSGKTAAGAATTKGTLASPSSTSGQSFPFHGSPGGVNSNYSARSSATTAVQPPSADGGGGEGPGGYSLQHYHQQHHMLTGIPSPGSPQSANNPAFSSTLSSSSLPMTNGLVGSPPIRATINGLREGMPRSHTIDDASLATSPFTPSARISALNIVGDLLRKVGALESKLATCRKYAADREMEKPNGTAVNAKLRSMSMTTAAVNKAKMTELN